MIWSMVTVLNCLEWTSCNPHVNPIRNSLETSTTSMYSNLPWINSAEMVQIQTTRIQDLSASQTTSGGCCITRLNQLSVNQHMRHQALLWPWTQTPTDLPDTVQLIPSVLRARECCSARHHFRENTPDSPSNNNTSDCSPQLQSHVRIYSQ